MTLKSWSWDLVQKCHEELGELLLEHSKVWKIVLWKTLFFQSIWCFSLKISEELCIMTLKGDVEFKGKVTCGLKSDIKNLFNICASSGKSGNLHFDGPLLSKAYKVLDEKVQINYVLWHWRVMQSLKKNWLLIPKMTWRIWWILMRAVASLKICTLICYFCQ